MTVTLDDLAGPADADMFRMTVDWGRWYIDPLPTCPIAEATENRWPSFSHVKKAAEKDWSFLVVNRMSAVEPAELHRIADLDRTQRGDAFRSHEKFAKNVAFGRGAITHLWGEDLGAGRECREITDGWLAANGYPTAARVEAEQYKRAMQDFFQTYQPELIAAEYVTIHRTLNEHGYGATPDGLFRIEGEVVAVDWKTRGESTQHAAYPEEAAQIACGVRADYMIVRVDDHAERRTIPPVDGGYVVSIRPDGARLYPVDIPKAYDHWCRLHQWWVWKQDEKQSIGRVRAKRSAQISNHNTERGDNGYHQRRPSEGEHDQTASGDDPRADGSRVRQGDGSRRGDGERPVTAHEQLTPQSSAGTENPAEAWRLIAKRRYKSWSEAEQVAYTERKHSIDTGDPAAVFALMDEIDRFNVVASPVLIPTEQISGPPPAPDEGGTVDQADVDALNERFQRLNTEAQLWTGMLVAQGKDSYPFRIKDHPTVRRYEIYRGILELAEWITTFYGDNDDHGEVADVVRGLLYSATGREEVAQETIPLGAAISTLDAAEAAAFAKNAHDYHVNKIARR